MIKLLIVDDHPIVLEGTRNIFKGMEDIVADIDCDVQSVDKKIKGDHNPYDVYLIDINMPEQNGISLSKRIRIYQPDACIILYTGDNIEDYYSLILDKSVDGLLSKTSTKKHILDTIRATVSGHLLLPSGFIDYMKGYCDEAKIEQSFRLNDRERQILGLVSEGYTNSAISIELKVTQRTVERYLSQIYNLFNVASRTEAVLVAKERKLI